MTRQKSSNQAKFLAAYRIVPQISHAAKVAGIARSQHYQWLESDSEYSALFVAAQLEAIENLEAICHESATIGLQEPIVYQGQIQYEPMRNKDGSIKLTLAGNVRYTDKPVTVRRQNPIERMFLLKALKPEMYREHATVEHTGGIEIIDRLTAGRARVAKAQE